MEEQTKKILSRLDGLNIDYQLHEHPPVAKALDRFEMGLDFGARVCKNLFLTTRNESRFYVLMEDAEKKADLKRLARAIGSSRLCFASDERLYELMGQKPGMVSPLGVIEDRESRVTVLLDAGLREGKICVHPSDNRLTLVMDFSDMERYVRSSGHEIIFIAP